MSDSWCVLMASRRGLATAGCHGVASQKSQPDALAGALRRAASVTAREHIAVVITGNPERSSENPLEEVPTDNLFVEPMDRGTGLEVLFALAHLQSRVSPLSCVLFLPTDHVVENETAMTRALAGMIEWIAREPRPVYLLGAVPRGPHERMGYIVPWHDTMHMPTSVYEFVEGPCIQDARKLIHAGGLWNTFIFGGTFQSLMKLFSPEFDTTIASLRATLRDDVALVRMYHRLTAVDFSRAVLAAHTDQLHVLRLPHCGWRPFEPPNLDEHLRAETARW